MITPFIGRKIELQSLKDLYEREKSTLTVIKGRRRIGKSFLVAEFAKKVLQKNARFFSFTGLPPKEGTTDQHQRDHFIQQLSQQLKIKPVFFDEWTQVLNYFAEFLVPGDIVLFDEISWMGIRDINFVGKLKAWWDVTLSQKDHVFLVFCSSVSTWIEENILKSTAFFGRVSLTIALEPFLITEGAEFLKAIGFQGSAFEVYEILSILGGVPWYLEHINPKCMALENIRNLCFTKNGLLTSEFHSIFHDIFNGKGTTYKKILSSLNKGIKTLSEIREDISFAQSGTLSLLLEHLITAGFVTEHDQWSFKTGKLLKHRLYRILDPYTRFYLKNIEPLQSKITKGVFNSKNIATFPGFDSNMGLQVENLLLQNRSLLLKALGIDEVECLFDGPYRQTKTLRTKGCQIDYLVQTRTGNLFLCEFKFNYRKLDYTVIDSVKEKMKTIAIPRGTALVPVLFHMGEVSGAIYDARYFYRIINIMDFV